MNTEELVSLLYQADQAYYLGETPLMSDSEYDELKDQVPSTHPYLNNIGFKPTTRLGHLPIPMFSQHKVKTLSELQAWIKAKDLSPTIKMVLTPKWDGNSLLVDEIKMKAWTRGDGVEGMTASDHFKKINHGLRNPNEISLSMGETIISKANFEFIKTKIFRVDGKPYTTARSMVAGLFNQVEATEGLEYVDYIRYDVVKETCLYKSDRLYYANILNTVNCPYRVIPFNEITIPLLQDLFKEWSQEYCLDGIVIEVNDLVLREVLGREPNGNPAYSRAYKGDFEERVLTKIKRIRWQPSKDRVLVPVADIVPVKLEGATVKKCTLYNANYIHQKGITEGCEIEIMRSGGVMPKITRVINPRSKAVAYALSLPNTWQGIPLQYDGVNLFCIEANAEINIQEFVYFFKTFKVEIGTPTLTTLYTNGYTSIPDIFNMTLEDLIVLPGFGVTGANNFLEELQTKVFKTTLHRIMAASNCFSGMAEKTLDLFPEEFLDLEYLQKDSYFNSYVEKYNKIEGIGITTAIAYVNGWQEFLPYWEEIRDKITLITKFKGTQLAGQSLVFSGFRDNDLREQFEKLGGEVKDSISKSTTYLVLKDEASARGKAERALQLGVKIINKDQLIDLISSSK